MKAVMRRTAQAPIREAYLPMVIDNNTALVVPTVTTRYPFGT